MTQCKLKRNIQQIAAKYQNNPDLIIYLKKKSQYIQIRN